MTGWLGTHFPRLKDRGDGVSPLRGRNGLLVQIVSADPLLLILFRHDFVLGDGEGLMAFAVFANNTGCLHNLKV